MTEADAAHRRGIMLEQSGDLAEARAAFESALALMPDRVLFHHSLARIERFVPCDPRLPPLQALAQRIDTLPPDEQVHLCFALGKAYADLGERDRAFRHYLNGNAIRRRSVRYDEAAALGFLRRIQQYATAETIAAGRGHGAASPAPVFILGMPRSGSTLLEQILASHPQVHGGGELHLFGQALAATGIARLYPDAFTAIPSAGLRQLGERYATALRKQGDPAAVRITDKMPTNYLFLGLIHLALPNATIIHTRRDPIDCCLSNFTTLFAPGRLGYSYDLGELGRYYRACDALMRHWHDALPNVILDVRYEELVAGIEPVARRVVAHCGLAWDDACLQFPRARRQVQTASVSAVRQPVYASAIGRWQGQRDLYAPLLRALDEATEAGVTK